MPDPTWLKSITAREQAASEPPWESEVHDAYDKFFWIHAAGLRVEYDDVPHKEQDANADFVIHSRTDIPLLRDMLRFVAETLEYIAGPVGEVSAKDAAREALAAYRSGVLPKGEPHA